MHSVDCYDRLVSDIEDKIRCISRRKRRRANDGVTYEDYRSVDLSRNGSERNKSVVGPSARSRHANNGQQHSVNRDTTRVDTDYRSEIAARVTYANVDVDCLANAVAPVIMQAVDRRLITADAGSRRQTSESIMNVDGRLSRMELQMVSYCLLDECSTRK